MHLRFQSIRYYQPAGPLINVPHGHSQPPLTKSVPLSEPSPTSTSPLHQPPPAPSSNGDSSDSEVIITSVTTAKDPVPPPPQQPPSTYRYGGQYPPGSPHPGYSYSYPSHYYPPAPAPSYHHDLCYPPATYLPHKYPPSPYRRYLPPAQYYPPNAPDLYSGPPGGPSQQSQQVVTTTPVSSSGSYPTPPTGPPLVDSYSGPPLVDYAPPPPHYYPGYPPPPPPACYTHSPTRTIPYINAAYQSCPCPMQSCPKNVLTGPLTGDSKRSNISSIAKDSMPLPPVALALPLEPASAMGPPSPARGSAGMPPPPSPAGATYQPPPPAPKQESLSPEATECKPAEKKRKARVGKAMVRNNIAANFPENTMLLMCNPVQNSFVSDVKREIESPKEKEAIQKKEICSDDEVKVTPPEVQTAPAAEVKVVSEPEVIERIEEIQHQAEKQEQAEAVTEQTEKQEKEPVVESVQIVEPVREELEPCVRTVAENVKVKNMKRKMSLSKEPEIVQSTPSAKKQKMDKHPNGSYKDLIKKDTCANVIKINNGKRKLLVLTESQSKLTRTTKSKQKQTAKRKRSSSREEPVAKKLKQSKPLIASNLHNAKQNLKESCQNKTSSTENKEPLKKTSTKKQTSSKSGGEKKLAPAILDNLIAKNNIDRTIDCVISESVIRTPPKQMCVLKVNDKPSKTSTKVTTPTPSTSKKSTNLKQGQVKNTVESLKRSLHKKGRKNKSNEVVPQVVSRIPRKSFTSLRWSNGWTWQGEPYEAKVFLNSDETTAVRMCYPAMRHAEGDVIECRDCVLLKAGPRKNDLPFVAKIAALWENPEDGEMMMSLLWYYRPEHTEQGRLPTDMPDEVFASRHKDSNSVACIDDKCYVLTFNEYCRYRSDLRALEAGIEPVSPRIPLPEPYPRSHRLPSNPLEISPEMVFFCRRVYDFRQKRIVKNPS